MSVLIAPQPSAAETAREVAAGRLSAEARVAMSLGRMEAVQPTLNAFTCILREEALEAARQLDLALRAGTRPGPLCGVPVVLKDLTPSRGHPATRGSWTVDDEPGTGDPAIVRRLRAAGAIVVGKTTTPEFAYSSFTQSPRWGVTRNPHDPSRTPGGSSGGSAVAVASGCVPLAEGTDMGGSVRIPAALCGTVGLKPSLGRIPMDILPSCFDDMSHFGPLAATVEDAALFTAVVQGPDEADILSQTAMAAVPVGPVSLRGQRFALSLDLGYYAVDPVVEAAVLNAVERIRAAGATVAPVDLGWSRRVNDLWLQLWGVAQAAFWGQNLESGRERMDPDLVALMKQAEEMGAVAFKRLEVERTALWRSYAAAVAGYNAFLCPTCAVPAPPADRTDADYDLTGPDGRYHGLDMTCPFNLFAPCPAISLPLVVAGGLPVGLQIVGARHDDAGLLALAWEVERALVESRTAA